MNRRTSVLRHGVFECPDARPLESMTGFDFVEVTGENVASVSDFRGPDVVRVHEGFLRDGRRGVYAIQEESVVAHAWLTVGTRSRAVVNGYFPLRAGDALIHHCNVAEHVRGRGLFEHLIRRLISEYADLSYGGKVLIDADVNNLASLRTIERVNCRLLANVTFLAWRGRSLTWPPSARRKW